MSDYKPVGIDSNSDFPPRVEDRLFEKFGGGGTPAYTTEADFDEGPAGYSTLTLTHEADWPTLFPTMYAGEGLPLTCTATTYLQEYGDGGAVRRQEVLGDGSSWYRTRYMSEGVWGDWDLWVYVFPLPEASHDGKTLIASTQWDNWFTTEADRDPGGNTIALRNHLGQLKVTDPEAADDAATKAYVDAATSGAGEIPLGYANNPITDPDEERPDFPKVFWQTPTEPTNWLPGDEWILA